VPPLLLDLIFGLIAAFWLFWTSRLSLAMLRGPALPSIERLGAVFETPRVSVIIAARDEERRIETTVVRLLAQRHVDLELIVVDDRSTDSTPEILARLASRDPRLRTVRVDALPEGWIAKTHALHLAGSVATGDWLLFTDADCWMSEEVVARAVRAAQVEKVDHVTISPTQRKMQLTGKAASIVFAFALIKNGAGVNQDRRRSFIGIGAFNLVRTDAWRALGGHEPLRLEICDDMKLGLLLSRAGRRTRAYWGGHDMEVEWAATAGQLVRAIEKNIFAMLRFSVPLVLLAVGINFFLWGGALLGPLTGRPAGIAAGLALATLILPARMVSRRAGWGWLPALLAPLFFITLAVAVARSALVTLARGGVRWRDTFYPLAQLRRGVVK